VARKQQTLQTAGQKVKMFSVMIAFAITAVILVAHFTYVVSINHQISSSLQELRALQDEGNHLKLEIASLQSPERLEKMALEAGLQYPGQDQLIILTAGASGN
jgi:cell division protein FtsL